MDSPIGDKLQAAARTFPFQFLAVFAFLWLATWVSSTFDTVTTILGVFLVLLPTSWHLAKLIQRSYFNERLDGRNKAVLVTGCDSGFGHSLAKRLNQDGYFVFAACLNPEGPGPKSLLKLASNPRSIQLLPMDVTNDSGVQEALHAVSTSLSKSKMSLWAVVNNAGIAANAFVEWGQLADYEKIFAVNVLGLARVTRAFLPLIRKSKGRVVNVSSLAGRIASPAMSAYAMSKHAVVAFSNALRREMAPWGVKVCLIEPSGYKTAMTEPAAFEREMRKMWGETSEQVRKDYGESSFNFALKFLEMNDHSGDPEEVVEVMMHALSAVEPEAVYAVSSWKKAVARTLNDYLPFAWFDALWKKRGPPVPQQQ